MAELRLTFLGLRYGGRIRPGSGLYLGFLVRKRGNEEFSHEEFLVRKWWRGKNEEKLVFLGKKLIFFRKKLCNFRFKNLSFFSHISY